MLFLHQATGNIFFLTFSSSCHSDFFCLILHFTVPLFLCMEINFTLPISRAFLARVDIVFGAFPILLFAFADLLSKVVKLVLGHCVLLNARVSKILCTHLVLDCMLLSAACTRILHQR